MVTDLKAKGKALADQHRASLGRYSKAAKREAKRQLLSSLAGTSGGTSARRELKRLSTHTINKRGDSGIMNPYSARGKETRNPLVN